MNDEELLGGSGTFLLPDDEDLEEDEVKDPNDTIEPEEEEYI